MTVEINISEFITLFNNEINNVSICKNKYKKSLDKLTVSNDLQVVFTTILENYFILHINNVKNIDPYFVKIYNIADKIINNNNSKQCIRELMISMQLFYIGINNWSAINLNKEQIESIIWVFNSSFTYLFIKPFEDIDVNLYKLIKT